MIDSVSPIFSHQTRGFNNSEVMCMKTVKPAISFGLISIILATIRWLRQTFHSGSIYFHFIKIWYGFDIGYSVTFSEYDPDKSQPCLLPSCFSNRLNSHTTIYICTLKLYSISIKIYSENRNVHLLPILIRNFEFDSK